MFTLSKHTEWCCHFTTTPIHCAILTSKFFLPDVFKSYAWSWHWNIVYSQCQLNYHSYDIERRSSNSSHALYYHDKDLNDILCVQRMVEIFPLSNGSYFGYFSFFNSPHSKGSYNITKHLSCSRHITHNNVQ